MQGLSTQMWFKGASSSLDTDLFSCVHACVCEWASSHLPALCCSPGNRQQHEKQRPGVIGKRFYPLWPIKMQLCIHKQPIRRFMLSWGDKGIVFAKTEKKNTCTGEHTPLNDRNTHHSCIHVYVYNTDTHNVACIQVSIYTQTQRHAQRHTLSYIHTLENNIHISAHSACLQNNSMVHFSV